MSNLISYASIAALCVVLYILGTELLASIANAIQIMRDAMPS